MRSAELIGLSGRSTHEEGGSLQSRAARIGMKPRRPAGARSSSYVVTVRGRVTYYIREAAHGGERNATQSVDAGRAGRRCFRARGVAECPCAYVAFILSAPLAKQRRGCGGSVAGDIDNGAYAAGRF